MRVRVVLEWLGVVEPDRRRREPVAVPAWGPYAVAAAIAVAAGVAALAASVLLRALLS